ncbi:hypothetical protein E4T44_04115 [Aureobasidium sp. EXF-8845]|nr:hypothetical protein E4T44_04115 [Aureobasidium sp. EXF-8845]KAI4853522.1 hypothetical protein E4T45_04296 [Aureobasidium sp. EXF-8846]
MPLRLSDLPLDILDMIACQLNCHDICNLRLVSRAIDAASTQTHYKSFFISNKTVELASARVSKLADFVQHSRFVPLLQHLKITAGAQSRDQGTTSYASQHVDVLRRIFRSLCKLHRQSDQYCLRSLTAGVAEEDTHSSRTFMTQSAARSATGDLAVRTTLRLVNDSDMPIEQLHLLYRTLACSVPCCIFESPFGSAQSSSNWSRLRCLSLSLTHHVRTDAEVGLDESDDELPYDVNEETTDAGNRRVQAVVDFFSLIPNVEELNLQWYGSRIPISSQTAADHVEKLSFEQVLLTVSFEKLKHLSLWGLRTTQAVLLSILKMPPLLEQDGSFRPILDYLISPTRALTQYHLDDIYEQQKLIHFACEGIPKLSFEPEGPLPGPSEVLRKGQDVTLPLEYGFASRRPLHGPELALFRRRQREQFGRV